MRNEETFKVLYCSLLYRNKKLKTWQDGFLKFFKDSRKLVLFDENLVKVDSRFHPQLSTIEIDEQFELDGNLVLIEALQPNGLDKTVLPQKAALHVANQAPEHSKRKRNFQPLRLNIKPKVREDIVEEQSICLRKSSVHDMGQESTVAESGQLSDVSPLPTRMLKKGGTKRLKSGLGCWEDKNESSDRADSGDENFEEDARDLVMAEKNKLPAKVDMPSISKPVLSKSLISQNSYQPQKFRPTALAISQSSSQRFAESTPDQQKKGANGINSQPHRPKFVMFPKSTDIKMSKRQPIRETHIPATFSSRTQYLTSFTAALNEHLQLSVNSLAENYYQKLKMLQQKGKRGRDLESHLRSAGISFYLGCTLSSLRTTIDDRISTTILVIELSNREHHSAYSKDDLWLVGDSPDFKISFLGRSTFFGPASNLKVDLIPLSEWDIKQGKRLLGSDSEVNVTATKLMNVSADCNLFSHIEMALENLQIAPHLLGLDLSECALAKFVPMDRDALFMVLAKDVTKEFALNEDQAKVLISSAKGMIDPCSPITLVHGAFGAGKSFLIAVLVVFYSRAIQQNLVKNDPKFRIIISSNTNVAVDRVLQSLLKLNFHDFVRVGCIKKIAKTVLPYTAQQLKSSNEDLKELNLLLKEGRLSETEQKAVQTAIKRFSANENQSIVSKALVIGVTCMASIFEVLNGINASLVILDECSQMTEPSSMLAISRFQPQRLLLVGDPLQLPPTLPGTSKPNVTGLERTLFERLGEMSSDLNPILLRTQYRVKSDSWKYKETQLTSTKSNSVTQGLEVSGLPTVCFIRSPGVESHVGLSLVNRGEAEAIVEIVKTLVDKGVEASDIGIIALYKSQAELISCILNPPSMKDSSYEPPGKTSKKSSNGLSSLQVSTVDAFQGAEKSIILLSTVRSQHPGFIDDARRINVALTRAQRHLLIFGTKELLEGIRTWGKVMQRLTTKEFTTKDRLLKLIKEAEGISTIEVAEENKLGGRTRTQETVIYIPKASSARTLDTARIAEIGSIEDLVEMNEDSPFSIVQDSFETPLSGSCFMSQQESPELSCPIPSSTKKEKIRSMSASEEIAEGQEFDPNDTTLNLIHAQLGGNDLDCLEICSDFLQDPQDYLF